MVEARGHLATRLETNYSERPSRWRVEEGGRAGGGGEVGVGGGRNQKKADEHTGVERMHVAVRRRVRKSGGSGRGRIVIGGLHPSGVQRSSNFLNPDPVHSSNGNNFIN